MTHDVLQPPHVYPLIERTPAQMRVEVYDSALSHFDIALTTEQADAVVRLVLDQSDCADLLLDIDETVLAGDIEAALDELGWPEGGEPDEGARLS